MGIIVQDSVCQSLGKNRDVNFSRTRRASPI